MQICSSIKERDQLYLEQTKAKPPKSKLQVVLALLFGLRYHKRPNITKIPKKTLTAFVTDLKVSKEGVAKPVENIGGERRGYSNQAKKKSNSLESVEKLVDNWQAQQKA